MEQALCFPVETLDALIAVCNQGVYQRRLDVFLPLIPFYELARARRRRVPLGGGQVFVWDAATLCAFKLMFFRRRDLADVEQVLRAQGKQLDRSWIRLQLEAIFGKRDPRIPAWDELCRAVTPEPES